MARNTKHGKKPKKNQAAATTNAPHPNARPGNQNALGRGAWGDAIRRAVSRAAKAPKGEGNYVLLNKLADALVKKGGKGNVQALKEIGDRLDGKVPQAIEGTGPNGEIVTKVTIEVV